LAFCVRDLVAAVEAEGSAVPLPDGRIVTVGCAEFDALLSVSQGIVFNAIDPKRSSLDVRVVVAGQVRIRKHSRIDTAVRKTHRQQGRL
jgi:hypothetical protein